eukprot:6212665-Pleurochrysis_carterae.AAC.1
MLIVSHFVSIIITQQAGTCARQLRNRHFAAYARRRGGAVCVGTAVLLPMRIEGVSVSNSCRFALKEPHCWRHA